MTIREKAMRYGEGGRGFAMLTLPAQLEQAPVVALLNAGLLHRAEPYRLNVLVSRKLAELGYLCVRVDLSGKGETPPREGLTNRESVALDWRYLCEALERQFGPRPMLVMGMCSGADNGIKLAATDQRIRGLILLDVISPRDALFRYRHVMARALCWRQWARLPRTVLRRLLARLVPDQATSEPSLNLRDLPRPDDLQSCLHNLVRNDGRMLMFFTNDVTGHYNQQGQFSRTVGVPGLERICTEYYWPDARHVFPIAGHRARLVSTVAAWAQANLPHLRASFATLGR